MILLKIGSDDCFLGAVCISLQAKRTHGKSIMPRKGEYGYTTQRCAYCGKPEVSRFSSISSPFINRHYCSLECSAKDNQSLNLGCSLCILPVSIILSVGLIFDLLSQNRVDGTYLTLYSLILLFQIIMVYQVYVGRTTPQSEL